MSTLRTTENYVRGVSFDTMTDQDQPDYSFTLRGKTPGYQRTRRSRTFMVATDLANYSDYALDWAIEVSFIVWMQYKVLKVELEPYGRWRWNNRTACINSRPKWYIHKIHANLSYIESHAENRVYVQQTLRKEEQQSKERASVVMNKIMTASGPDMKVIVIHHKRQEKKKTYRQQTFIKGIIYDR